MAEHIIKITETNYDAMLTKGVQMARAGVAVGFDLSGIDAGKRQRFLLAFNKASNEGVLMQGNRRSAQLP